MVAAKMRCDQKPVAFASFQYDTPRQVMTVAPLVSGLRSIIHFSLPVTGSSAEMRLRGLHRYSVLLARIGVASNASCLISPRPVGPTPDMSPVRYIQATFRSFTLSGVIWVLAL